MLTVSDHHPNLESSKNKKQAKKLEADIPVSKVKKEITQTKTMNLSSDAEIGEELKVEPKSSKAGGPHPIRLNAKSFNRIENRMREAPSPSKGPSIEELHQEKILTKPKEKYILI